MTETHLSWFFLLNDRPVKVVRKPDGGMDVLVLNLAAGEFERNLSSLSAVFKQYKDVDRLTEEKFNRIVERIREEIKR